MISLQEKFLAGNTEENNFDYIGLKIIQEVNSAVLDQSVYVEKIKNKFINPERAQKEQTEYKQPIEQLNWAIQGTRLDTAFELIDLSTKLKEGQISDLSRTVKISNKLNNTGSFVTFQNQAKILVTDASLCNINDGTGNTAAHIVWLMDQGGKCCPLYWHSGKK